MRLFNWSRIYYLLTFQAWHFSHHLVLWIGLSVIMPEHLNTGLSVTYLISDKVRRKTYGPRETQTDEPTFVVFSYLNHIIISNVFVLSYLVHYFHHINDFQAYLSASINGKEVNTMVSTSELNTLSGMVNLIHSFINLHL